MPSSTDIAIMRMVTDITVAHLASTRVETVLLPQLVSDLYRAFKALERERGSDQPAPEQVPAAVSIAPQERPQRPVAPRQPSSVQEATLPAAVVAAVEEAQNSLSHPESAEDQAQVLALKGYRRPQTDQVPAVPIDQSVKWDYIVCLEDGKHLQMLKRYLRTRYQMSIEQYRAKWGLPSDYPATAPGYSAQKSQMAKRMGLGKTPKGSQKKRANAGSDQASGRSRA